LEVFFGVEADVDGLVVAQVVGVGGVGLAAGDGVPVGVDGRGKVVEVEMVCSMVSRWVVMVAMSWVVSPAALRLVSLVPVPVLLPGVVSLPLPGRARLPVAPRMVTVPRMAAVPPPMAMRVPVGMAAGTPRVEASAATAA
jgi:hypothetical protein